MLKKFIIVFILLIIIDNIHGQSSSNFYGSFESNGVYYEKNEDEKYKDKFASNNYLNLKYILNSRWNFEVQVESYSPIRLQNYSDSFENTHLSTLNINYSKNTFGFTIGSIYEQFGSGLILRTWEDRQL